MAEISGTSATAGTPGVAGSHTGGGDGVVGTGRRGVVGQSDTFQGVVGKSRDNAGVVGESDKMHAIFGITHSTFAGVFGASDAKGAGVTGECKTGRGVHGVSESGDGVYGTGRRGVVGISETYQGVFGKSRDNSGVVGESDNMHAIFGISHGTNNAGIFGTNDRGGMAIFGDSPTGIGVVGRGGVLAARFDGDVEVTGDIRMLNADFAEDFDVGGEEAADPGTVVVLGDNGVVLPSRTAYDKRVAGVISGAGGYAPGIILDRRAGGGRRLPVALVGKVLCKVNADDGPVEMGDLLTTSPTPGHAMKVANPSQAFGAVIGKALRALPSGRALVPILVALQ